jgi:hypothetical protein
VRGANGFALAAVSAVAALALTACGSESDSARVAAMIDAKYGVNVAGCTIEQRPTAAHRNTRATGLWGCNLSAPRTDRKSGVTDTAWCVTNASPDDLYESAILAYPSSTTRHGCR